MLISIIVPVYKVEEYLEECIESVINQSYTKWEMILVDDGSPDNCPQICDRYTEKDNRITVIHKSNGGLSSARNRGIESASGEYIVFLDSDDVLLPNAIETIVGFLEESPDVLITEMYNTTDVKAPIVVEKMFEVPSSVSKESAISFVFTKEDLTWPAQQYIVKRQFIQDNFLRFEEGYYHEDVDWTAHLFLFATKLNFCPEIWYIRRFGREGSITTVPNPKRTKDMIELVAKQERDSRYNQLSSKERDIMFNQLARAFLSSLVTMNLYQRKDKYEIYKALKNNSNILQYSKAIRHKLFYYLMKVAGPKIAIDCSLRIREH